MACKDCEAIQNSGFMFYYRYKNANIAMSGCKVHVQEIFENLNHIQQIVANYTKKNKKEEHEKETS